MGGGDEADPGGDDDDTSIIQRAQALGGGGDEVVGRGAGGGGDGVDHQGPPGSHQHCFLRHGQVPSAPGHFVVPRQAKTDLLRKRTKKGWAPDLFWAPNRCGREMGANRFGGYIREKEAKTDPKQKQLVFIGTASSFGCRAAWGGKTLAVARSPSWRRLRSI